MRLIKAEIVSIIVVKFNEKKRILLFNKICFIVSILQLKLSFLLNFFKSVSATSNLLFPVLVKGDIILSSLLANSFLFIHCVAILLIS